MGNARVKEVGGAQGEGQQGAPHRLGNLLCECVSPA